MKGIIFFVAVMLIIGGAGLYMQNRLAAMIDNCVQLLQKAEQACADSRYGLALAYAKEFSDVWKSERDFVGLLSKRDNYEEISETAMRLIPLLEEKNYSEFRSDCRTTINFLELLRRSEVLSWQGVT